MAVIRPASVFHGIKTNLESLGSAAIVVGINLVECHAKGIVHTSNRFDDVTQYGFVAQIAVVNVNRFKALAFDGRRIAVQNVSANDYSNVFLPAIDEIERLRVLQDDKMQNAKTIYNLSKMAARFRKGLDQIYDLHNSGDKYSEREINDMTYGIVVDALAGYKS